MKYLSPEHKILRLLWKFSQNRLVVKDRFMTDGDIDMQKVKDVLISQGMTIAEARDAFQLLVAGKFTTLRGKITVSGIQKINDMEVGRNAEIVRLGLSEFFSTATGTPDEATLLELSNKEY